MTNLYFKPCKTVLTPMKLFHYSGFSEVNCLLIKGSHRLIHMKRSHRIITFEWGPGLISFSSLIWFLGTRVESRISH